MALVVVVVATTLLVAGTAQAREASRPALRVLDRTPFTVSGSGFGASERVRLVLNARGRYVRIVRASRSGAVAARFAVNADMCTAFTLRAVGAAGSMAVAARKAPPECAPLDPVP
jgi:hypothetical protein